MAYLRWAACGTAAAALLHVAIMLGGAEWYRFFGAGEGMARLARSGSVYPTVVTSGIACALALAAVYGLSGAAVIRPLPLLRPMLVSVAVVFLARALLGIPAVFLGSGPYMAELRGRLPFMAVTSLVCLALGLGYAAGAVHVANRTPPASATEDQRRPG